MGNIGEWSTVYQGWHPAEGLYEVRIKGITHQCRERTFCVQVTRSNWAFIVGEPDGDIAKTLLQVFKIRGQAQNGHDFRSGSNGETGFSRHAVRWPA